jgi:glycosyltransferase involved in cell wall biosynthesis
MHASPKIAVVIPVFNEQEAIQNVLSDIPRRLDADVVVVDNGSTDRTVDLARQMGARIVHEHRRGYGWACLAGIDALETPDIVVFLDGDYSDHPDEMTLLVEPIVEGHADLVIGSRTLGTREAGALLPQARFGNWLATWLIRRLFGANFTDLGPFRALTYPALVKLDMQDKTFGWTVEMQVKAARMDFRFLEVPVSYRRRIGVSKITGTISGTIRAGWKILYTIFKYRFTETPQSTRLAPR